MITQIDEFKKYIQQWYHGSKTKINTFTLNNNILNNVYGSEFNDNNLGIFFTDNITMSKQFAGLIEFNQNSGKYENTNTVGYIYNCDLDINNPWILQEQINNIDVDDAGQTYFNIIEKYKGGKNFRDYLIKNNYDSVIVYDMTTNYYEDGTYSICVVLDPNKIKINKIL